MRLRRLFALACAVGVGAAVVPAPPAVAGATEGRFASSELSTLAGMAKSAPVRITLVGKVGRGQELADQVRRKGGTIRMADDAAGFVVAEVTAAEARSLHGRTEASVVALDRHGPASADATGDADVPPTAAAATSTGHPRVGPLNPYLPTASIGAPQFVQKHPRFDGRGVKIAVVDSLADWTVDGLQATTTNKAKVAHSYSRRPSQLVRTNQVVKVGNGTFVAGGVTYRVPRGAPTGNVRFGKLTEAETGADVDLDLDGVGDETYGVAVFSTSSRRHAVYVDTDGDRSFADERKLTDWNASHATATFGTDRADTPHLVEVRPFGLNLCQPTGLGPCAEATDGKPGDLWSLVSGSSGTAQASVAAGNGMRLGGGRFDGVAPGAELWMFDMFGPDRDVWASDLGTAIVLAARERADVIVVPATLGPWLYADHVDTLSPLVDNVIEAYDVPVTTSAAGTVGVGASDSAPQGARKALLTGPYINPRTYEVLMGRKGLDGERFGDPFVTPGPHSRTGRPVPDVLAPSPTLFAYPKFLRQLGASHTPGLPEGAVPPGYSAGFRWGMAGAMSGGTMALLISAAKAERVPYTAHTLKRAVELSGRPLWGDHTFTAAEVGSGLIQVDRAWQWLKRLSRDRADTSVLATVRGDYPSGVGAGVYQRTSSRATEAVTLTSTAGRERTYRLRADQPWIGLDRGTLRLAGAASFAVRIDPVVRSRPGAHTGTVVLDDVATADPADLRVPVTVVVPVRLEGGEVRLTGQLAAEAHRSVFVEVPAGTRRLELTLARPDGSPVGVDVYYRQPDEHGHPWESLYVVQDPAGATGSAVIGDPLPGVLELTLHADESGPLDRPVVDRHGYDLTVRLS